MDRQLPEILDRFMKSLIVIAFLFLGSSLHAGLYVKFDTVKGSSQKTAYIDWSEASSFTVHGSRSFVVGSAAGKPSWEQFEIIKNQDRATSEIMARFCTGAVLPTVKVVLTTNFELADLPILEIILINASIGSQELSNGGYYQSQGPPIETIGLNYQKIAWRFTPIATNGSLDVANRTSGGWDIVAAKTYSGTFSP